MSNEQKPSEFWAWMNRNITGYGILVFCWLAVLVILAIID